ncbi:unnamed protein product [Durusdinium trenchii]|uniref:Uncharacterized protein n=1 Tax=Durusdinium trenchii TaxID=1381693 RepID=A0ABP0PIV1_9DINO
MPLPQTPFHCPWLTVSWRGTDPGIAEAAGMMPGGRPREFTSWAKNLVVEMSRHLGIEVSISQRRILLREVLKEDRLVQRVALSSTRQALRLLTLLHLCRWPFDSSFRCALLQFPREAHAEDPLWATICVRESVPWRSLTRHPDVYHQQTHLLAVKLDAAELKLLKLEGRVIAETLANGKVQRGWRLCPGGDLPRPEKKSDFAAQLLGVETSNSSEEAADLLAAAFASLAAKCAEDSSVSATLFFEKVTKDEFTAQMAQRRAMMVDLCFQAHGDADFLKDIIEVPRQAHMQTEAMLLGASLARLAVVKEVPVQPSETAMALQEAMKALHGSAEVVAQLAGTPSDWLFQQHSRSFGRVLCNEPVGDVVEAWRALSSEDKIVNDAEYFTDQFLSLSFYGRVIASAEATSLSIEGPLLARHVLVNFSSSEPSVRLWEAFPVLSKPGRFAAQLWGMLRFDDSLKSFGEARDAMAHGFFRCYCQDAVHAQELRLRLHLVLTLLELIWFRRQCARNKVVDMCPELPAEVGLREALRQEVLETASAWKRLQKIQRDAAEESGRLDCCFGNPQGHACDRSPTSCPSCLCASTCDDDSDIPQAAFAAPVKTISAAAESAEAVHTSILHPENHCTSMEDK